MHWTFLREVLRHKDEFESLVSSCGVDIVNGEGRYAGQSICYWDLFKGWESITDKQREAITLMVLEDRGESESAFIAGFDPSKRTYMADRVESGLKSMAEFH